MSNPSLNAKFNQPLSDQIEKVAQKLCYDFLQHEENLDASTRIKWAKAALTTLTQPLQQKIEELAKYKKYVEDNHQITCMHHSERVLGCPVCLTKQVKELQSRLAEAETAKKSICQTFRNHMATQHGHAQDCDCSECFEITAIAQSEKGEK